MFIINFFQKLSDRFELEHSCISCMIPSAASTLSGCPGENDTCSVRSVMEEEYPEHMIHVMDIHSHNTMPASFSR